MWDELGRRCVRPSNQWSVVSQASTPVVPRTFQRRRRKRLDDQDGHAGRGRQQQRQRPAPPPQQHRSFFTVGSVGGGGSGRGADGSYCLRAPPLAVCSFCGGRLLLLLSWLLTRRLQQAVAVTGARSPKGRLPVRCIRVNGPRECLPKACYARGAPLPGGLTKTRQWGQGAAMDAALKGIAQSW